VSNIVGVDQVQTSAVLENLGKFIDDPRAIPAHSLIRNGSSQVIYGFQPQATFNVTPNWLATTIIAGTATNTERLAQSSMPGAQGNVSGNFQELQNLQFTPVTDGNALRNLQSLYRHAVHGAPLKGNYTVSPVFVNEKFYPNPFELQEPNCVLCARKQGAFSIGTPALYENRRLKVSWLKWDLSQEQIADGGYVSLGHYGSHDLYISRADRDAGVFSDFVLYTFGVTPPPMSFPTSDLPVLGTLGTNGVGRNVGLSPGEVGANATTSTRSFSQ